MRAVSPEYGSCRRGGGLWLLGDSMVLMANPGHNLSEVFGLLVVWAAFVAFSIGHELRRFEIVDLDEQLDLRTHTVVTSAAGGAVVFFSLDMSSEQFAICVFSE